MSVFTQIVSHFPKLARGHGSLRGAYICNRPGCHPKPNDDDSKHQQDPILLGMEYSLQQHHREEQKTLVAHN